MANKVQILRSSTAGNRPTGRSPGELYANFPDSQFGVINAASASQDLIAVRFFSALASYVAGDHVIQSGALYKATTSVSPAAFNVAQWNLVSGTITVSDTAPTSPQNGNLWFDSIGAQLYVYYNDGTSSQWVVAVNPLGSYLQNSGGSLTGPLILAADPVISLGAATKQYVDGIRSGDNRIINGDMRIDQRNSGASGTAAGVYTVDRWVYQGSQATKGTWQRAAAIAGSALAQLGFGYSLTFTSSSAYTPLTTDAFNFHQRIEADFVTDFAWGTASAQPVTLSFLAQSSLTGTFSGAIVNAGATRSYPFSFSLTASTWAKIVITIPGDTTGVWTMAGSGEAGRVIFDLGSGATFRASAGIWAAGDFRGATGAINVVGTNTATFIVTGVKLETGSFATPFNHYSLARCMADCQRYYQSGQIYLAISGQILGGAFSTSVPLPVPMRIAPTMGITTNTGTNWTLISVTSNANMLAIATGTSTAAGQTTVNIVYSATAEL
jgi:hypothetical protein